jgi:hypothetical protein
MSETTTPETRALHRSLPSVDAWFYLALALVAVAIGMGISLR